MSSNQMVILFANSSPPGFFAGHFKVWRESEFRKLTSVAVSSFAIQLLSAKIPMKLWYLCPSLHLPHPALPRLSSSNSLDFLHKKHSFIHISWGLHT
jgi:hypothetical protein